MKLESRVMLSEAQHALLMLASSRAGMPLSTYLRTCAIQDARENGMHVEQPSAD